MKIAITGSDGFVGSHLISLLKHHTEVEIVCLDLSNGIDVCDWDQIKHIQVDLVIHLANKSYVPDSYQDPTSFYKVNVMGTLNMLELARMNQARFIYFSSYVYGHPQYLRIDEQHPIAAFNPYATTKVMCEEMCRGYARDFKVPVAIFRPFNIYGKGQNLLFLLPLMANQIKEDAKIQIRDDRPKRDYIHISDVVRAVEFMSFCEWPSLFEIYNLGTGISYSVKEVAQMLIQYSGNSIEYLASGEQRPNEVLDTIANINKLENLGWKPEVSIEEGLKDLLR